MSGVRRRYIAQAAFTPPPGTPPGALLEMKVGSCTFKGVGVHLLLESQHRSAWHLCLGHSDQVALVWQCVRQAWDGEGLLILVPSGDSRLKVYTYRSDRGIQLHAVCVCVCLVLC